VGKPGRSLDLIGEQPRGAESIDVAAAPSEPAIEAVAERGGVGHTDIQRTLSLDDSLDLGQRGCQVVEVFQAVIRNNKVEGVFSKRQMRGVGPSEVRQGSRGGFAVDSDHSVLVASRETAFRTAEIENQRAGGQGVKQLVHILVYRHTA